MPLKGQQVHFHLLLRKKLITRLKDPFSPYKWAVVKLSGFYAWTKISPLSFGVIFPSPLETTELEKIGPESNGLSEH